MAIETYHFFYIIKLYGHEKFQSGYRSSNSHIRHSRAGRAFLRWRKECGRLWVQLASAVQAPMHSVAYMYIDSY